MGILLSQISFYLSILIAIVISIITALNAGVFSTIMVIISFILGIFTPYIMADFAISDETEITEQDVEYGKIGCVLYEDECTRIAVFDTDVISEEEVKNGIEHDKYDNRVSYMSMSQFENFCKENGLNYDDSEILK